jgi:uncharacterized protein with FMN-binding domain
VRRISYWILSTVAAAVLLFGFDASQRGAAVTGTPAAISGGTAGTTSSSGTSSGNGRHGATGSSGSKSSKGSKGSQGSKSSTSLVTGQVVQTQCGPVQVRLTIAGGSITKVTVLQYPNGNSRDVEIANYSLPVLIRETIASQSAHIDMVSGATYTSTGYVQSLQSAIDQANL